MTTTWERGSVLAQQHQSLVDRYETSRRKKKKVKKMLKEKQLTTIEEVGESEEQSMDEIESSLSFPEE